MNIIFGEEIAEELKQRHIVLELETFIVEGEEKTAYCVVMPESIIAEMSNIEQYQRLHQGLIDAWNQKRYSTVLEIIEHLRGKFGGELDSFYEILEGRIKEQNVIAKLQS